MPSVAFKVYQKILRRHHQIIDTLSQLRYLADKEIGKKSIILWEIFSKQVPNLFSVHQGFHFVSFI